MAHVTYIDPIATVSGKLVKRHRTTYMVRRASTANPVMLANPCFTTVLSSRQTELSEAEQQYRRRFGAIAVAVNQRLHDSDYKSADLQAFRAQSKYRTLRQYVWHQVAASQQ